LTMPRLSKSTADSRSFSYLAPKLWLCMHWHRNMRNELGDDITVFSRAAIYIYELN